VDPWGCPHQKSQSHGIYVKKRAVAEEGAEQRLVRLQRAGGPVSQGSQLLGFEGGPIGEGVHFQIAPGVLDGVEFGRVGRQEESMQLIDTFNELGRAFGSVGIEAIPNQQAEPRQLLVRMPEESDDLEGGDVSLNSRLALPPRY
jgi:hypothetical protein